MLVVGFAVCGIHDCLLDEEEPKAKTDREQPIELIMGSAIALPLWSTILLRTPGTAHQFNLVPLWSWYLGLILGDNEIRWQIYFNILLFMPFGFFSYLGKARPLGQILLRGFLLSLFVEAWQYLFCLGLFEWDDLLHNSLGCVLGGVCGKLVKTVWNLHRMHKSHGRK